jgi:hypothetical protein
MDLGTTVEGFPILLGDTVWVPVLKEIAQPIEIRPAPTKDNPDATSSRQLPPKKIFVPDKMRVTGKPPLPCYRRYQDCNTECEIFNRGIK